MGSADERADLLFALYAELGEDRSLARLQKRLQALGSPISLPSLKRYSARYRWCERLTELVRVAKTRRRDESIEHLSVVTDRHLQLARALQGAGGSALQRLLANDSRLAALKPAEIVRLVDVGLRSERLTIAEEIDRRQIAVTIWNRVVVSIVDLFREVNGRADEQERIQLFAEGVDSIVAEHLAEVIEGGSHER